MERTIEPTAVAGLYTEGEPGVTPPTAISALAMNGLQEEIMNAIEGSGQTPDAGDFTQLWNAISVLGLQYAYCAVSATAVASGTHFSMTLGSERGGFSVATNQLTVPADGLYLILFNGRVENASTSNPTRMSLSVEASGLSGVDWAAYRPTATAADTLYAIIAKFATLTIGNPLNVEHGSASSQTCVGGTLLVIRMG